MVLLPNCVIGQLCSFWLGLIGVILTVSNVKGGSGKTTSAVYLAHALAVGGPVVLVDACPSGSATLWADDAKDLGMDLPFEVVPLANPNLGRRVKNLAKKCDVVIDSAPANAAIGMAAVEVGDFVLIPANARPDDVRQAAMIANQALQVGRPSAAVLVRVRPQESSMSVCRSLFIENDVAVFDTEVNELTSIGWSFGTRVENVEPYDRLLTEIREVFGGE